MFSGVNKEYKQYSMLYCLSFIVNLLLLRIQQILLHLLRSSYHDFLTKVTKTGAGSDGIAYWFCHRTRLCLSKLTDININEGEMSFILKQANTDWHLATWSDLKAWNEARANDQSLWDTVFVMSFSSSEKYS